MASTPIPRTPWLRKRSRAVLLIRSRAFSGTTHQSTMAQSSRHLCAAKKMLRCALTRCDRSVTLSLLPTSNTSRCGRQGHTPLADQEGRTMTTSRDELTIDDLLGDPLTHTIMKADRVDPSELEAMVRALAARIGRLAGRSNGDALARDRVAFDHAAVSRFLRSMDRG